MTLQVPQEREETSPSLPDVVPLDIRHATQLSWDLGSLVVGTAESELEAVWEHAKSRWTLSIYRATGTTSIVEVTSPVGREHFYGVLQSELEAVRPDIEDDPCWQGR